MTYACPKCGETDRLDVFATVRVRLIQKDDDEFETDADASMCRDHEWDGNAGMICVRCEHGGNVSDFEVVVAAPGERVISS